MQLTDARVINNTRLLQKQAKKSMKMSSNRKNKVKTHGQNCAFNSHFMTIWSLESIGNPLKPENPRNRYNF